MWWGHLAVTCDGYILDATLPQVNRDGIDVPPLAVPLPHGWDTGTAVCIKFPGVMVDYQRHPKQVGFRSAGDARPSHWRPILDRMRSIAAAA